jgi:glucose/mannose-6-phosphate isomerase
MSGLEPPYGALDSGGMAARLEGIPDQIDAAVERLAATPWRVPNADPDLLAVGGMGGSAIAADLAAGADADRLPRPMLVVRDERWPACVTARSLALLSSYSGNTDETLSLYRAAAAARVPRVALTSGGTLASLCAADGVAVTRVPGGSPPRAALYASWVAITGLLNALGWIPDPAPAWREASALLRARARLLGFASSEAGNPAKQMARALHGRFPLIYSGAERLAAVGLRWRQQLNENAKLLGHSAVVPELDHNEIVGWERPGTIHANAAVIVLRDDEDSPGTRARLTLTADYARRQGAAVHEAPVTESHRLGRLAALVQFGDYVSFYLALLNGVDPTPIASIDAFKQRLTQPEQTHGG